MHLYEVDHPYYGPDGYGNDNEVEDFEQLREVIEDLDQDMNHVYRWDWLDWAQPHHAPLHLSDEDRRAQDLCLYVVVPRKGTVLSFKCPVTHEQEPEVRAWLAGPRILGALRTMWEPLLDNAMVCGATLEAEPILSGSTPVVYFCAREAGHEGETHQGGASNQEAGIATWPIDPNRADVEEG